MTQHTELIDRLRKLALAATPGPWESISRAQYWGEKEGEVHGADGEEVRGAEHVKPLSSQETMRGQAWLRDTDYIACAHPQNILGLLDALEAQAREIAELKAQLAATAKNAFLAMPPDIPRRMKRKICVNAGWSGSMVSRMYTELRKAFTGEPYKGNEDLDAALTEIGRRECLFWESCKPHGKVGEVVYMTYKTKRDAKGQP